MYIPYVFYVLYMNKYDTLKKYAMCSSSLARIAMCMYGITMTVHLSEHQCKGSIIGMAQVTPHVGAQKQLPDSAGNI